MKKRAVVDDASKRMAEQAIRFWRGDTQPVLDWLGSIGVDAKAAHGHWTLDGPSKIRCGLAPGGDPITVAVQFGFATAGMFWPQAFPGLLAEVNRLWKLTRMEAQRG